MLGGYKLGVLTSSHAIISNSLLNSSKGGNLKTARRQLSTCAIKFAPNNKTAHNNLGLVCQELQDLPCVLESYRKGTGNQTR